MKVRATQDGHFGGYYRLGPVVSDQGEFPGEVFEIPDGLFPVPLVGEDGIAIVDPITLKPEYQKIEIIDAKTGKKEMRTKMFSWFTPSWMQKVSDDTPLTAELDPKFDYPPFQVPVQYRARKTGVHRLETAGVGAISGSVI
jgi:hypothetical protein